MSIFARKNEETAKTDTAAGGAISVKILGGGCSRCNQLEASVKEAITQLGLNVEIEHVKDFEKIAAYGVMSTPALVINGKVVSCGKVLSPDEAKKTLEKAINLIR